jgi:hypothetical protein
MSASLPRRKGNHPIPLSGETDPSASSLRSEQPAPDDMPILAAGPDR